MVNKYLTQRAYRWSLVTYASIEEIQKVCERALHYAYILHDRDDCEPHRHVLLVFRSQRTLSAIRKDIASEQNTNGQKMRDICAAYRYLTHEEKSDKQLYQDSDIVCDDVSFWQNLKEDDSEDYDTDHMLDDIICGKSFRELARLYGRDFMKNHRSYTEFAEIVYKQEHCGVKYPYQHLQWRDDINDFTDLEVRQSSVFDGFDVANSLKAQNAKKYRS